MPGNNSYLNPENYPAPSFQVPVTAPNVDPDEGAGAVVVVGINEAWIPVIEGALDQLLLPSTWAGDHDAVILALNRASNLKMLVGSAEPAVDPPYWDETKPEEAGDENPTETGFPWYEDLAFMFLEGFLATLVSPPAAYAFITVSKKLRLFFIYGQHGALFDIQIDGDTVATVDTYAPTEATGFVDVIIP